MGVNLEKGATVDLTKAAVDAGATAPLTKVIAGAGWDTGDHDIDLDLMSIKLADNGKAINDANGNGTNYDEAVNFYKNVTTKGIVHSGDNTTGKGDGDDETLTIDLAAVEAEVSRVAIVVASFTGETFDKVANVKVRTLNADGNTELAAYTNSDLGSGLAVHVGDYVRNGDNWSFEAKGELLSVADGKKGGELVKAVLESFGVTGL
jgi:tellurium resistance protein TerD